MAVPKKRNSHSRTRMRRNHLALKPLHLSSCENCGAVRKPHCICEQCGQYRGKVRIKVESEFE